MFVLLVGKNNVTELFRTGCIIESDRIEESRIGTQFIIFPSRIGIAKDIAIREMGLLDAELIRSPNSRRHIGNLVLTRTYSDSVHFNSFEPSMHRRVKNMPGPITLFDFASVEKTVFVFRITDFGVGEGCVERMGIIVGPNEAPRRFKRVDPRSRRFEEINSSIKRA